MCYGPSNFQLVPPPFAVLALLGLGFLETLALGSAVWGVVTHRRRLATLLLLIGAATASAYLVALLVLSAFSRERVLDPGEEKYFCELDCHLAYSVVAVEPSGSRRIVTLRVRFDEDTIAPWRPRGIALTPNPRSVRVLDSSGRVFAGQSGAGRDALPARPLRPGESYLARLVFDIPPGAENARLLITEADWPTRFLLGHENSPLHGKTSWRL